MHTSIHIFASSPVQTLAAQAARALPDTIVTKQVVSDPGMYTKVGTIATTAMALGVLFLAIVILQVAWRFRGTSRRVEALVDRIEQDILPLARSAGAIAEDVRAVTASVKDDALQVQQTVAAANDTIRKTIRRGEERIERFDALLEVLQDEAESTFLNVAATVRGVRRGLGQVLDRYEGDEDGDYDSARAPGARPAKRSVARNQTEWDVDEDE